MTESSGGMRKLSGRVLKASSDSRALSASRGTGPLGQCQLQALLFQSHETLELEGTAFTENMEALSECSSER